MGEDRGPVAPARSRPAAPDRGWAAPDAPSGAGATGGGTTPPVADPWSSGLPRAEAGVAVVRGDARTGPGPDDEVLLGGGPLRAVSPTGPAGVLDGAFELLRFRFGRLVGLTALLFLPIQLAELVLALTAVQELDAAEPAVPLAGLSAPGATGSAWVWVLLAVRTAALCLLGLGVGVLVTAWWEGRDRSGGAVLSVMVRRWWVAVVLSGLCSVVKAPLLCLGGVGWFLGDALLFVAGVVAGAERLGPVAAFARTVRLTRPAYGLALVTCVGGFVISQVLQLVLTVGPVALVASFQPPEEWLLVLQQASSLVLLVVLPLTACIAARAYVELRCRVEGADLVHRQVARGLA